MSQRGQGNGAKQVGELKEMSEQGLGMKREGRARKESVGEIGGEYSLRWRWEELESGEFRKRGD